MIMILEMKRMRMMKKNPIVITTVLIKKGWRDLSYRCRPYCSLVMNSSTVIESGISMLSVLHAGGAWYTMLSTQRPSLDCSSPCMSSRAALVLVARTDARDRGEATMPGETLAAATLSGRYTELPKTYELVFQLGIRPELIYTYAALSDFANNKTGECYPQMRTIAGLLGRSVRTVQRHLHELQDFGLVEFVQRLRDDSGRYRGYLYRILHTARIADGYGYLDLIGCTVNNGKMPIGGYLKLLRPISGQNIPE